MLDSKRNRVWAAAIHLAVLLILIVCSSCTGSKFKDGDPKGRLADYISLSFSIKSTDDKAKLMSFLTGDVKSRFAGWSEDQFREAFLDSKREFLKLLLREMKE